MRNLIKKLFKINRKEEENEGVIIIFQDKYRLEYCKFYILDDLDKIVEELKHSKTAFAVFYNITDPVLIYSTGLDITNHDGHFMVSIPNRCPYYKGKNRYTAVHTYCGDYEHSPSYVKYDGSKITIKKYGGGYSRSEETPYWDNGIDEW